MAVAYSAESQFRTKSSRLDPELDHLAACVRVVLQIVQIPHPVRLAHPEMAAIGFHQGVE